MKNVTMIAAVGSNLEIGRNNKLIWQIKEDLRFFKEQTMGKPMLMGYKTFFSLRGGKPLPGRQHIILTHNNTSLLQEDSQIKLVRSIDEALRFIEEYKDEIMVIGGASIYKQMLQYAEKLVLTEIDQTKDDADAFFPAFDKNDWTCEQIGDVHYADDIEEPMTYKHLVYTRK